MRNSSEIAETEFSTQLQVDALCKKRQLWVTKLTYMIHWITKLIIQIVV